MKLRNKKTGEIFDGSIVVCLDEENGRFAIKDKPVCESISELKERFEDYNPRIEDEKVRKIVKEWLMISLENHMNIFFDEYMNGFYLYEENSDRSVAGITFPDNIKFNLENDKDYTFAELCGDEDE